MNGLARQFERTPGVVLGPTLAEGIAKLSGGAGLTIPTFTLEKDFQAAVVIEAVGFGFKVYHTYDSRRSEKGFLDLVMLNQPRQIVAELKLEGNTTTPEQDEWIEAYRACGVPAFVWFPRDWFQIVKVLSGATDGQPQKIAA